LNASFTDISPKNCNSIFHTFTLTRERTDSLVVPGCKSTEADRTVLSHGGVREEWLSCESRLPDRSIPLKNSEVRIASQKVPIKYICKVAIDEVFL
jgi:hypothetical protein